ncbi:uncharacterized protein PITG_21712 [Phytophthora infestans T30-4]|uniref:Uncharacterized protein n=1 Tax=Phytophthora infestans (strain T30-4) TaxID=403677 RepID=D0P3X2_PHYIT|nr:uncharacterized protein PITG_21712 [Phytophthora infestans T30-4]EEY62106.1 hypothetical protein PITG_21712 [Phytophthora infestans T30-4]|eukprot:XP_002894999.1 hypothetical protein PITG_21712 [Phytophthora infestans T30-4]
MYTDNLGLADRKLMKKAATAITEALRQSGTYKLFFMARLENGRVGADDLSAIETVISSIAMADVPLTVISIQSKRLPGRTHRVKKYNATPSMTRYMPLVKMIRQLPTSLNGFFPSAS